MKGARLPVFMTALALAALGVLLYAIYQDGDAEKSAVTIANTKTVEERAETLAELREYTVSAVSSTSEEARMESLGKLRELASNAPPQTIEEREARLRAMRDALGQ